MQAPYDREHGQGTGGGPAPGPEEQPAPPGDDGPVAGSDPYLASGYHNDPYPAHDPLAQDPVEDARRDRAAHPPPPPGSVPDSGRLYQQPPAHPSAPDPHRWAATPPPEPEAPSRFLPHGDQPGRTEYTGVDGLVGWSGADRDRPPTPPAGSSDGWSVPPGQQQTGQSPGQPSGQPPGHGAWLPSYHRLAEAPDAAGRGTPAHRTNGPESGTETPGSEAGHETGGENPPTPTAETPAEARTDAFAHLYRDQQSAPRAAAPNPGQPAATPTPPPAPRKGRPSLLKSSAIMAAGTLVSRATGFVRQLIIVAALGAAVLGDTYSVAWALPSMIYILTIGGGLNSVFVPQLVRAMKNDDDGGEAYANRLLTLVLAVLAALVIISVVIAPLLIRMMSSKFADDPAANEVAVTFARYCLPTIFFMGAHVVMGQILNARDRFGPMMWTPVLNNIVVIFSFGLFLWVYGTQSTSGLSAGTITAEGVRLLGMGTLLGLVVQAVAMVPYLRAAGFRIRPRFDWVGHGMGKAMRLAKWTVLFVFANQLSLVVITQFSTWAGANAEEAGHPGTGFIAYSSALLIWQMPQAIITVSIMAALLPRISRSAAEDDHLAVRDDLSHGLRTSAVAIVPIGFAFLALGVPICTLLFSSAGEDGARSFGYILMAFGIGLIPFSAQYVVLRAFYAYEDTRTPFYNTLIVSLVWIALSTLSFLVLPDRWVVAGIAATYGIAYALGVAVAWRRLRNRMGTDLDGARVARTYVRLVGASVPAALLGGGAAWGITQLLGSGILGSLVSLTGGGIVLLVVFYAAARKMRIEELTALVGMVRSRLGR